jgi:hypothetical protein
LKIEDSKSEIDTGFLPDFEQISCNATRAEIDLYFGILTQEKNATFGLPYMTIEDVELLKQNNFAVYNCRPKPGHIKINLTARQKVGCVILCMNFIRSMIPAILTRPK